MSKVTIIVPVYNAEKTLDKCLESLVCQIYEDIEILLINDGSTDNSVAICQKYEMDYSFVKLFSQSNSGPATARNKGIDLANGEYISFVDADDYVEPDYISVMIDAAEKSNADIVICSYYEEKENTSKVHTYKLRTGLYEGEDAKKIAISLISDVTEQRIPPYSWVRMIKKEVFNSPKIRYTNGMVRSEDYYLFTELHFNVNKVYLLSDTPLYHYIDNTDSVTHSYVNKYWKSVLEIYEGLKNKLPKEEIIQKNLGKMLIQRSMIALNNSSLAENYNTFKTEVFEIIYDKALSSALRGFSFSEGMQFFGPYYLLMRLRLHKIVYYRYAGKRLKILYF